MISQYKLGKLQKECDRYFYEDKKGKLSAANTVYSLVNEIELLRNALTKIAHETEFHGKDSSISKSRFAEEVLAGKYVRIDL